MEKVEILALNSRTDVPDAMYVHQMTQNYHIWEIEKNDGFHVAPDDTKIGRNFKNATNRFFGSFLSLTSLSNRHLASLKENFNISDQSQICR